MALVCSEVLGFIGALSWVGSGNWTVNHGEERRAGLGAWTYHLNSLPYTRHGAGHPVTFMEGQVLP